MDNSCKCRRYFRLENITIVVALILSCANNVTRIQSEIDKHAGIWVAKNNVDYSYQISTKAKSDIAQSVDTNDENWRKTKESVFIFYLTDLDSTFNAIGKHEISLEENGKDMKITENGITYEMIFEYYKGVFFPKSVHRLINKE